MPRESKEYEIVEEFDGMVRKLIDLNGEKFGHIDPNVLRMAAITNKESSYEYKVKAVANPTALFCPDVRFIITVFMSDWESYSEDRKALIICKALLSLEPDEKEPKVNPFDLSDHSDMIRTFGIDYLENPEIQGLLTSPIDWK